MKKLSFFLMAMLFSVMSFAAEATATISFADKAQRTEYSTSKQVWEQNGIVVTNEKASSTSNVGDYANPARFYKSSKVTIQCTLGNITKIEISNCGESKYATPWNTNGDAVVNGTSATITPTSTSDTYTIATLNAQARAGQMVITYEVADAGFVSTPAIEGEQYFKESATVSMKAAEGLKVYYTLDGTDPTTASTEYTAAFEVTETTTVKAIASDGENASDVVTVVFKKMQVLTCAEAAAITPNGDKYIVRGYVTSASEYNTQYNNIDFFVADTKDGGEVLKVYRAVAVTEDDKAIKVGDYVEVIGELAAFYETIQIAQGGTYTIIPEPVVEEEIYYEPYTLDNLEFTDNGDFYVLYATISDYNLELTFGVNAADGTLMEESSIVFGGEVLPIVSSEPVTVEFNEEVQTNVYTVRVVVEMRDGKVGFEFIMYKAADSGDSTEPVTIAVVGATASVSNDGWLVINGTWNELPFVLKVAGYEDTPYKEYTGTQVGEMEFGEWGVTESDFGFADAVTVIKTGDNLDIMGIFESLSSGTTYNVSVSASFAAVDPETAVDNINASVAPAKMIVNGQLIIVKDGVKFNAAGAVVK